MLYNFSQAQWHSPAKSDFTTEATENLEEFGKTINQDEIEKIYNKNSKKESQVILQKVNGNK